MRVRRSPVRAFAILILTTAALLASIGQVAAARTANGTAALTTTTAATSSYTLVRGNADHTGATSLAGATLAGNVYIFVPATTGITRVVFYLDGVARRTENLVPWDFAGTAADGRTALPFDTKTVTNGSHTVRADVSDSAGVTTLSAAVSIANTSSTPAPTPTPTPTAPPATSGPWSAPFLSLPTSGQIVVRNCSNLTISGHSFVNLAATAIVVDGCSNVTITGNDFSGDKGGIFVYNSKNVTVTWNRFQNIGTGTSGSGNGNYVQFSNTWGGYIGHNKGVGGNTEDLISIFQSGGTSSTSPLVIEYNALQGTNWSSGSSSGTMLGDMGGSHIVARYNTLLSPGQVGMGVPSGTDIHITDNTIYGAQRTGSNVGIYVWNQASTACSGIEVARNLVRWYRADGVLNGGWNGGNCGTVSGWSTNTWSASIDPTTLQVKL